MPGGDRTGPMGAGPGTGRAAGYCAGYDVPGYMNPYGWYGGGWGRTRGRGRGRGWGRGMGWRHGWGGRQGFAPMWGAPYSYEAPYPVEPPTRADELEMLKEQYEQLEAALKNIQKRMKQLEKEGD